jgi:hypothetical protein
MARHERRNHLSGLGVQLPGMATRSPRPTGILIAAFVARLLFKGAALVGALALIAVLWFGDASLLTRAADENLRLVKEVTRLLPTEWASRIESAFRISVPTARSC